MNERRTSTNSDTPLTQACSPAVQAELTRVRGIVRRLPEGAAKERASLLAAQLENGVPADMIKRQLAVMAG
jgi:hypothetical protein